MEEGGVTGNGVFGGDELGHGSSSTIPAATSSSLDAFSNTGFDTKTAAAHHSPISKLASQQQPPAAMIHSHSNPQSPSIPRTLVLHIDSESEHAVSSPACSPSGSETGTHLLGYGSSSVIPAALSNVNATLASSSSSSIPSAFQSPVHSHAKYEEKVSPATRPLSPANLRRKPSWLRRPTLHVDARDEVVQTTYTFDNLGDLPTTQGRLQDRLIVVVFGLPARGKTFISTKIGRYLNWVGIRTRVFSCTAYRRNQFGPYQDPEFFDYRDPHKVAIRRETSRRCLHDMFKFFYKGGQLAVFNAHNVSQKERDLVTEVVNEHHDRVDCKVLWVEAICDDPEIVERNIMTIERHVTELRGKSLEEVAEEYRSRIRHYEAAYESMECNECSYIRYFSPGYKVVGNRIEGYIQGKIMSFLSNLRMIRYPLLISRHGESIANQNGHIGGNSELSELGREYGNALGEFIAERKHSLRRLKVWSSTLKRSVQTAGYAECVERTQWPALNEIGSGKFEGLTYDDIREKYPEEYEARSQDKLRYRYPNGESYLDVMRRLEPIIYELERADSPVLLVSHKALLRCLCGYFLGTRLNDIPSLPFPPHAVVALKPHPYGFEATRYELGVEHAELESGLLHDQ